MAATTSPAKRRVLGALDANACSPKPRHVADKLAGLSPVKAKGLAPPRQTTVTAAATSPARVLSSTPGLREREVEGRKRLSPTPASAFTAASTSTPATGMASRVDEAEDSEPAAKRPCLGVERGDALSGRTDARPESPPSSTFTARTNATARLRSASPDSPSVFDTSAADNSQATILTEPDTSGPAPAPAVVHVPVAAPRPRPRLTREQAREKAEILRLRLGLASYKVRTGQTDVPLDRLEELLRPSRNPLSRATSFTTDYGDHNNSQNRDRDATYHQARGPTSVSASFPPPSGVNNGGGGVGRRRPLPGGPVRRGSVAGGFGPSATTALAENRAEQRQMARPSSSRAVSAFGALRQGDGRSSQHQYQQQRQHQPYQHQHHHQRRQSDVVHTSSRRTDMRRYSEAGVPPRPHTATEGVAAASVLLMGALSRGRSFALEEEVALQEQNENDDDAEEDRGGAASGLLSLARS